MFRKLTLRTKIVIGSLVSTLLLLVAVSTTYIFLKQVNNAADTMEEAYLEVIQTASDIESNTYDLLFDMRGYNFTGDETFLDDAQENIDNLKNEIDQIKVLVDAQPRLTELKDLVDDIELEVSDFEALMVRSKATFDKIELNRMESDQRADELFDVLDQFTEEQESELLVLIDNNASGSTIKTHYIRMTTVDEVNDIISGVVTTALEALNAMAETLEQEMSKFKI